VEGVAVAGTLPRERDIHAPDVESLCYLCGTRDRGFAGLLYPENRWCAVLLLSSAMTASRACDPGGPTEERWE